MHAHACNMRWATCRIGPARSPQPPAFVRDEHLAPAQRGKRNRAGESFRDPGRRHRAAALPRIGASAPARVDARSCPSQRRGSGDRNQRKGRVDVQREHRPRQPEAGTRVFWESARAVLPRICVSLAIGIAQMRSFESFGREASASSRTGGHVGGAEPRRRRFCFGRRLAGAEVPSWCPPGATAVSGVRGRT